MKIGGVEPMIVRRFDQYFARDARLGPQTRLADLEIEVLVRRHGDGGTLGQIWFRSTKME
jgi:hypothetical protein